MYSLETSARGNMFFLHTYFYRLLTSQGGSVYGDCLEGRRYFVRKLVIYATILSVSPGGIMKWGIVGCGL